MKGKLLMFAIVGSLGSATTISILKGCPIILSASMVGMTIFSAMCVMYGALTNQK